MATLQCDVTILNNVISLRNLLTNFRRYCKDVDECANDNGGCPMKCLNQEGTFSCACNFGYLFTNNGCQVGCAVSYSNPRIKLLRNDVIHSGLFC